MNNPALKKWIVLMGLLLLTLILVWQAPEPEQADRVEVTKPVERQTAPSELVSSGTTDNRALTLKPRQSIGETVDLFAVPARPEPQVMPVVNKPVEEISEKTLEFPFHYLGMLKSQQRTTLFVIEKNSTLQLVHEGDTVSQDFRLQRVDSANNELVWLYLPLNETRKMSMDQ